MIDRSWIGHEFAPLRVEVEPGRLRQFAKAVGETRPEYVDVEAARQLGWPALPVPPTFLFCLEMEQPDPWHFMGLMGIDLARVLHGEQEFNYLAPAWAGDTLTYLPSASPTSTKSAAAPSSSSRNRPR